MNVIAVVFGVLIGCLPSPARGEGGSETSFMRQLKGFEEIQRSRKLETGDWQARFQHFKDRAAEVHRLCREEGAKIAVIRLREPALELWQHAEIKPHGDQTTFLYILPPGMTQEEIAEEGHPGISLFGREETEGFQLYRKQKEVPETAYWAESGEQFHRVYPNNLGEAWLYGLLDSVVVRPGKKCVIPKDAKPFGR